MMQISNVSMSHKRPFEQITRIGSGLRIYHGIFEWNYPVLGSRELLIRY